MFTQRSLYLGNSKIHSGDYIEPHRLRKTTMGVSSISYIITNTSDGLRHYILYCITRRGFSIPIEHSNWMIQSQKYVNKQLKHVLAAFFSWVSLYVWPQQFNDGSFFSSYRITWKLNDFFSRNMFVRWMLIGSHEHHWRRHVKVNIAHHTNTTKSNEKFRKLLETQLKRILHRPHFGWNVIERIKKSHNQRIQ